jgi:hypothetical protein
LFIESILHSSAPNRSERRRFGLTPRITVPFVDIGDRDNLKVLMLKGEDYMGYYNVINSPNIFNKNDNFLKITNNDIGIF